MQDRFNLTGKVVVVTGGTGLLGSAYCQALADHGAQVVMADLAAADPIGKAKLVQTPTGVVAHGVNCDVGQEAQVVQLFADVMATFGRVDAVLNTMPTLAMVLKDAPGKYAIVKSIGADNWAGIAVRKEDPEIVSFLNGELTRLKADGTLARMQEKWFGFRMTLADKIPSFS